MVRQLHRKTTLLCEAELANHNNGLPSPGFVATLSDSENSYTITWNILTPKALFDGLQIAKWPPPAAAAGALHLVVQLLLGVLLVEPLGLLLVEHLGILHLLLRRASCQHQPDIVRLV